jgi:hypothetical protein
VNPEEGYYETALLPILAGNLLLDWFSQRSQHLPQLSDVVTAVVGMGEIGRSHQPVRANIVDEPCKRALVRVG